MGDLLWIQSLISMIWTLLSCAWYPVIFAFFLMILSKQIPWFHLCFAFLRIIETLFMYYIQNIHFGSSEMVIQFKYDSRDLAYLVQIMACHLVAGILLIRTLGTNFGKFSIKIHTFQLWPSSSKNTYFCLSVRPSATPFWQCCCHCIILKFSRVITIDRRDVHAKGQGQRSKVKVTEVMTPFRCFLTLTPVWIHVWWRNDAQSLMLLRRGALLLFKVVRQISRSRG